MRRESEWKAFRVVRPGSGVYTDWEVAMSLCGFESRLVALFAVFLYTTEMDTVYIETSIVRYLRQ
jgi:hypothetical protein